MIHLEINRVVAPGSLEVWWVGGGGWGHPRGDWGWRGGMGCGKVRR